MLSFGSKKSTSMIMPLEQPVEIMKRNHSSTNTSIMHGSEDTILPYSPDELSQLDISIVFWLKEIGQLKAMNVDFEKVDSV